MRLITGTLLLCLAAGCATPVESLNQTPQISLETLKGATETLSSDRFEGRAPTTKGEELTVSYLADRFKAAGLQPGNDDSWFQEVPLAENTASPSSLRISGGSTPITFAYRTDFVANSYQLQPRIALDNSELVFVGYGINAPERGWNDYAGIDVRGKTVVILVNDPDWQSPGAGGSIQRASHDLLWPLDL